MSLSTLHSTVFTLHPTLSQIEINVNQSINLKFRYFYFNDFIRFINQALIRQQMGFKLLNKGLDELLGKF